MSIQIAIPGEPQLQLDHLVLDVNGTLTDRGETIRCAIGIAAAWAGRHLGEHL